MGDDARSRGKPSHPAVKDYIAVSLAGLFEHPERELFIDLPLSII